MYEENKVQFDKKRKRPRKYNVGDIFGIKKTQFGYISKLKERYLDLYEKTKAKNCDR